MLSCGAALSSVLHYEPTHIGWHQDAQASMVRFGKLLHCISKYPFQKHNNHQSLATIIFLLWAASRTAKGAKNSYVSCQGMNICTLNCRSLSFEDRLLELEERRHITWDITWLSKIIKKGNFLDLKSRNILYFQGTDNGRCSEIGILVSKNMKNNIIKATSFYDTVTMLIVKLFKHYNAKLIQIYAPNSTCEDHAIEKFCNDVVKVFCQTRRHNLKIMNSFFKKNSKKKRTWRIPNGETNEIDYILIAKKYTVSDCAGINRFNLEVTTYLFLAR